MSDDQSVFKGWRESKRKRRLRILLWVIVGWNLIFIPLAIVVWPQLPSRASKEAEAPRVAAAPVSLPRPTVAPSAIVVDKTPPADVSPQEVRGDEPAVAQRPVDDGLNQLLSELGIDDSGITDLLKLVTTAQQELGERESEFSLDSFLDAFEARTVRPQGTPTTPVTTKPVATQPVTTQPAVSQPAAPLELAAEKEDKDATEYELTDRGFRVVEQTAKSWKFEWHVSIRNNTARARQFACRVKFTDKDGFVIDEGFKLRSFAAGREQTARGSVDIKLPYARDVVNMQVIASPR